MGIEKSPTAWRPSPYTSHLAQASRQSYIKSVALLVELASLQTAFLTLDEAIKTTNRRVNALDSVVKPMLENTIQYIKVRQVGSPRSTACVLWRPELR